MTKEQLAVCIASKDLLLKHLDERNKALVSLADSTINENKKLAYGLNAEIYNALALVCIAEIGTYQALLELALENEKVN